MSFFLAVDAGGTKTDYLLADASRELARVRTGTIKRMRVEEEQATQHLDHALAELTAITGISMDTITRTCIGTAGESVPLVKDWLQQAFAERVSGELILVGDVEIALDAAFPGQPGVLVLAGTGSNVAGRDALGAMTTAGGWGPALGDQASGHRIGHEALRALFLAIDERRPTLLLSAILDVWQLASIEQLVAFANRLPSPDFSRLAEVVLHAANQGDEVARSVLRREGEAFAHLVCLVIERLREASPDASWMPPIAFAGSIMEKAAPVRDALMAAVSKQFPAIRTLDGVVDPVVGALWRARTGETANRTAAAKAATQTKQLWHG